MSEHKKPTAKDIHALHAMMCQAIADPVRIALLYELDDSCEHPVNELVSALNLPQATVSRHLRTLRDRGLVSARRDSTFVFYKLADHRVLDALELIRTVQSDILQHRHQVIQTPPPRGNE